MTKINRSLELSLLPESFAILRLPNDAPLGSWSTRGSFCSITRTAEELSVVCEAQNVPEQLGPQALWRALKVHGPFALSETGVLAALTAPLADAKISVFMISTFDTDYLLVAAEALQAAMAVLEKAGHKARRAGAIL